MLVVCVRVWLVCVSVCVDQILLLPCYQVRVLSGQLRDAQNLLITRDRAAAVAAAAAGIKGGALAAASLGDPAAMVAAQRKAAELQRELCRCVRGQERQHEAGFVAPQQGNHSTTGAVSRYTAAASGGE